MADHRQRFGGMEKKIQIKKNKKTSLSQANLIAEGWIPFYICRFHIQSQYVLVSHEYKWFLHLLLE